MRWPPAVRFAPDHIDIYLYVSTKRTGRAAAPIDAQHSPAVLTASVTSLSGAKTCSSCPQHKAIRSWFKV